MFSGVTSGETSQLVFRLRFKTLDLSRYEVALVSIELAA